MMSENQVPAATYRESTQIEELEKKLADLEARFPAHSIPPSMMIELDELEEQLAALYAKRGQSR